jgi:hypothetical protein
MKVKEMEQAIMDTPKVYPVFEVVKVPVWCDRLGIKKGDHVYWNGRCMAYLGRNWTIYSQITISAGYLKFVAYLDKDGLKHVAFGTLFPSRGEIDV